MKVKKIAILSLSIVLLLQVMVFSVFAASGKAYIFTYTWSNLNTRPSGNTTVLRHLWNMGYDAGEYLNNGAADVYSVMSKAKILAIASHGNSGIVQLGTDSKTSLLYANKNVSGSDRSISNLSSNSLSGERLVMFLTCYSGVTSSAYGNLVTTTKNKGAQCVVGWKDTLENDSANDWIRLFFEKADKEHDVVWECFNHADYWVRDIHGSTYANYLTNRCEQGDIYQYLYK